MRDLVGRQGTLTVQFRNADGFEFARSYSVNASGLSEHDMELPRLPGRGELVVTMAFADCQAVAHTWPSWSLSDFSTILITVDEDTIKIGQGGDDQFTYADGTDARGRVPLMCGTAA